MTHNKKILYTICVQSVTETPDEKTTIITNWNYSWTCDTIYENCLDIKWFRKIYGYYIMSSGNVEREYFLNYHVSENY